MKDVETEINMLFDYFSEVENNRTFIKKTQNYKN